MGEMILVIVVCDGELAKAFQGAQSIQSMQVDDTSIVNYEH